MLNSCTLFTLLFLLYYGCVLQLLPSVLLHWWLGDWKSSSL